jgi:hypothetical protein
VSSPWTRSYKKDDEPLLNLTGAMSRMLKREGAYVYTKEGTRVLNSGALVRTRRTKQGIGGKCL